MTSLKFDQIAPAAPCFEELEDRSRAVLAGLAGARGVEQAMESVRLWDELRSEVSTWDALVHLRFHQDTQNAERMGAFGAGERCGKVGVNHLVSKVSKGDERKNPKQDDMDAARFSGLS